MKFSKKNLKMFSNLKTLDGSDGGLLKKLPFESKKLKFPTPSLIPCSHKVLYILPHFFSPNLTLFSCCLSRTQKYTQFSFLHTTMCFPHSHDFYPQLHKFNLRRNSTEIFLLKFQSLSVNLWKGIWCVSESKIIV
jgi:hypothetical protein